MLYISYKTRDETQPYEWEEYAIREMCTLHHSVFDMILQFYAWKLRSLNSFEKAVAKALQQFQTSSR